MLGLMDPPNLNHITTTVGDQSCSSLYAAALLLTAVALLASVITVLTSL